MLLPESRRSPATVQVERRRLRQEVWTVRQRAVARSCQHTIGRSHTGRGNNSAAAAVALVTEVETSALFRRSSSRTDHLNREAAIQLQRYISIAEKGCGSSGLVGESWK